MIFVTFSAAVAAADIKTGRVPRIVFLFAFPFFFAAGAILQKEFHPRVSITGLTAGLVIFLLAYAISGRKLGLADVWYSALIGLVLGPLWWFAAIGSACIAGIIYIFVSKQRQIPFIPCMALGSAAMCIIQG